MEKIKEFIDEDENSLKKILRFIEERGNIFLIVKWYFDLKNSWI